MAKAELLARLDAIGESLAGTGHALALLSFGSVGTELDRIDTYSDLDFFVVVEDGYQEAYIADLGWLAAVCPIAYSFRNTAEGYKLLFADGIYAEFAVFSPATMALLDFPEARIVWKAAGVDERIRFAQVPPGAVPRPVEALLGEALTNLYVGLGRYWRGERLSAMRFIQGYAVDRLVELAPHIEPEQAVSRDRFIPERRFEQRFPRIAQELPRFTQGYDRSPESAAALLAFLDQHWPVDPAIKQAIVSLLPADLAKQAMDEDQGSGVRPS